MIYVDEQRCEGCGTCIELCPAEAISMREGVAFIDESLCTACELCVKNCPQGAILLVEAVIPPQAFPVEPGRAAIMHPVETVPTTSRVQLPGTRSRLLPVLGSLLLWTGREVLPRLATMVLERREQPSSPSHVARVDRASQLGRGSGSGRGAGRRLRQRRGGRG